jgi:autotransporter-associated beta strand protein
LNRLRGCVRAPCSRTAGILLLLLSSTALAQAQDATWIGVVGAPNNWHNTANWAPEPSGPPPYVPVGTAFFNSSTLPTNLIDFGLPATIGGMTFTGAPGYTFTFSGGATLAVNGAGIVVDAASVAPIFNLTTNMFFANSATAGPAVINQAAGSLLGFFQNSNAGTALITLAGGAPTTLDFQDASSAGSATIVNNSGAFVRFNLTPSLLSASAGNSNIDNSGTVLFFNQSTGGNSTIITRAGANTLFLNSATAGASHQIVQANGNLLFQNGSSAGSSTIENFSNLGGVRFDDQSNAGSARITNNVGASITFNAVGIGASAANATIQNSGTLVFQANSTAANATIITEGGGQTIFAGTATGGSAAFVVNASQLIPGVLNLQGSDPSFTMGSLAGTSSAAFFGQVQGNTKNIIIGSNNQSTAYDGVITTTGSLSKIGTGTLTLSGFAAHFGPTLILDGELRLDNGQLPQTSSIFVDTPATLSGTGFAGTVATTTTISGALAPGIAGGVLPGGVLQLNGTVLFNPTASYHTTFNNGAFTLAAFTGPTTLAGTLNVHLNTANINFNQNYTILASQQPLNSQFQSNVFDIPATLIPTVTYNTNNVTVSFAPNIGAAAAGGNENQRAVGAAIQNGMAGASGPGAFLPLFDMNMSTFLATLSQLAGEPATGVATTELKVMDSFLALMLNPFLASRAGGPVSGPSLAFAGDEALDDDDVPETALAYGKKRKTVSQAKRAFAQLGRPYVEPDERFNVWASAYGGWGKTDGNATVGSATLDSRFGGVASGVDFRLAPGVVLGVAVGAAKSSFGLADGRGSGESDVAQAGAYAAMRLDRAYLSAAFAYGWHSVSTSRTVAAITPDPIKGSYDAHSLNGRAELGSRFGTVFAGITPFAAVQAQAFHAPAYQEQASGAGAPFALSYEAATTQALRSELGIWLDANPVREMRLRGRVAWAHSFTDTPTSTASFTSIPSGPFVVSGAKADPEALLASAAIDWTVRRGLAVTGRFDTEMSRNSMNYSANAGVRFTW